MSSSLKSVIRPAGIGLLALWVAPAHAYLDPGTGSLIIQGIIGAVAAAGVTCRLYWYKIKAFFNRDNAEEEKQESPAE